MSLTKVQVEFVIEFDNATTTEADIAAEATKAIEAADLGTLVMSGFDPLHGS
jgi:hypothetical protein